MKDVVILGAGIGSRLRPLTDQFPKLLVEVAGRTILDRALEVLVESEQVASITIAVGYKADLIAKHVEGRSTKIRLVHNHSYQDTNNMHSLYLALAALDLRNDIIVMNGDCVYEPAVINTAITSSSDCVFADAAYAVNDESMKIDVTPDGTINAIAKALQPTGTPVVSIDLYCVTPSTAKELYREVDSFQKRAVRDQWVEVALNNLLAGARAGSRFEPNDIDGKMWMEIDNFQDLELANARFAKI